MALNKTSLGLLFVDRKTVFIGFLVIATAFALGVIIGYFGNQNSEGNSTDAYISKQYVTDQFKQNKVRIR